MAAATRSRSVPASLRSAAQGLPHIVRHVIQRILNPWFLRS